jgi:hypothetical protein
MGHTGQIRAPFRSKKRKLSVCSLRSTLATGRLLAFLVLVLPFTLTHFLTVGALLTLSPLLTWGALAAGWLVLLIALIFGFICLLHLLTLLECHSRPVYIRSRFGINLRNYN